ncbi:MAG: enoyl-CoA hydratase [Mycobacterium sp.]|jgi:enoyl-CoA hydratase|nr:enoyl-CoA hydratase [Mycobacterium sp.]
MSGTGTAALVRYSLDTGVGRVHLDDPGHRNALSRQLSDDLAVAVEAMISEGAAAIVLTAEPPVFCAGGSLQGLLDQDTPLRDVYAGHLALVNAPVPTIAAVAGAALGAGVNLPLACDVIIAAESARFDPRFLDVGIHPGGAHLWRLVQRVGVQGAAALVLLGDVLTGAEAQEHGLAWRCVPDADLEEAAMTLARRAVRRSAPLMRRTKQTLTATLAATSFDDAFALELEAQEWSVNQPEFAEAVRRVQASVAARRGTGDEASTPTH